jgi:hypothetical protein
LALQNGLTSPWTLAGILTLLASAVWVIRMSKVVIAYVFRYESGAPALTIGESPSRRVEFENFVNAVKRQIGVAKEDEIWLAESLNSEEQL